MLRRSKMVHMPISLPFVCLLFLLAPGLMHPTQEEAETPTELSARLVAARPLIRPGEWFPMAFLVESTTPGQQFLGPPDDGTIAPQGEAQTNTRLLWSTNEDEDYRLVPDLTAIQWPRTVEREGYPRGVLELPLRIYVPVKATPKAIIGSATLVFSLKGLIAESEPGSFNLEEPIELTKEVEVKIVHPTDPEATDVAEVDPSVFTGWRGELPDWSVMDTRVARPKNAAPLLIWLVITIPIGILVLVLIWAFMTKRL